MRMKLFFIILCFLAPLMGHLYEVPEGYTPLNPCNRKEALAFWELLQKRGPLIGEKVTLLRGNDGTVTICNWADLDDLVLSETGSMEYSRIPNGETYYLYKGNLQNDGHLCYMLVSTGCGSGNFDYVYGVWKVIEDRIEHLNMHEDLANSFFPGHDAHLFYGYHADPFLIEKEGKVFMRWVDGYFPRFIREEESTGPSGMYTYYWEGNAFQYVPSLSKGNNPIVSPKKLHDYMARFQESQKKAISADSTVISSVDFETLKAFICFQGRSEVAERYPCIHLSKKGHFAVKKDRGDGTRWETLRLQSDVSLESECFDKYIVYRGNFLNDGRDIFLLIKTYNTLMFHDWEDTVWAWEVSGDRLKRLTLHPPTPWVACPFITREKGKYYLHFVEKAKMPHEEEGFHFEPTTILCEFQGKDNLKPIRQTR